MRLWARYEDDGACIFSKRTMPTLTPRCTDSYPLLNREKDRERERERKTETGVGIERESEKQTHSQRNGERTVMSTLTLRCTNGTRLQTPTGCKVTLVLERAFMPTYEPGVS